MKRMVSDMKLRNGALINQLSDKNDQLSNLTAQLNQVESDLRDFRRKNEELESK